MDAENKINFLYTRARTKIEDGDYEKALDQISQIMESYKHTLIYYSDFLADLLSSRASCYFSLGQYNKTINDCDESLALNPNNAGCWFIHGASHYYLGNYSTSLESSTVAYELDSNNLGALINRGFSFFSRGDYLSAIDDLITVNKRDIDNAFIQEFIEKSHEIVNNFNEENEFFINSLDSTSSINVERIGALGITKKLQGHDGEVSSVCITSDSKHAVSAGEDGRIIMWDLENEELMDVILSYDSPIRNMKLSKTQFIMFEAKDKKLILCDVPRKHLSVIAELPEGIFHPDLPHFRYDFSKDEKQAYYQIIDAPFSENAKLLSYVDLVTMDSRKLKFKDFHTRFPANAFFKDDSKEMVICFSEDMGDEPINSINQYNIVSGKRIFEYAGDIKFIRELSHSDNRNRFITSQSFVGGLPDKDGGPSEYWYTVLLWEVNFAEPTPLVKGKWSYGGRHPSVFFEGFRLTKNGSKAIGFCGGNSIGLWDFDNLRLDLHYRPQGVNSLSISPNGDYAILGGNSEILIWRFEDISSTTN